MEKFDSGYVSEKIEMIRLAYKQDYETVTAKILFEEVPYEIAATALR